jgi:HD-like signal output (HDOD) protein
VLFVDDEPLVRGLQRGCIPDLRGTSRRIGDEAITRRERPRRRVVCDQRMPGTSASTCCHTPRTIRMCCGYLCRRRTTPGPGGDHDAHCYLRKPATPAALEAAIRQTSRIHALLRNEPVRELVLGLSVLPTLPRIIQLLLDELRQANASVAKVGELVSQDPGLTAQLLRIVNSPYFGVLEPIADPSVAAVMLGIETVAAVLVQHNLFALADERLLRRVGLEGLFAHSTRTGRRAARLGQELGRSAQEAGAARAAGVLHDVGKIVLAINFPDRYRDATARARSGDMPLRVAETLLVGAPHDWVGGHLLALWGLPASTVEAVAFHHDPRHDGYAAGGPLALVHLANALEHARDPRVPRELDTDYLRAVGYEIDDSTWRHLMALDA